MKVTMSELEFHSSVWVTSLPEWWRFVHDDERVLFEGRDPHEAREWLEWLEQVVSK